MMLLQHSSHIHWAFLQSQHVHRAQTPVFIYLFCCHEQGSSPSCLVWICGHVSTSQMKGKSNECDMLWDALCAVERINSKRYIKIHVHPHAIFIWLPASHTAAMLRDIHLTPGQKKKGTKTNLRGGWRAGGGKEKRKKWTGADFRYVVEAIWQHINYTSPPLGYAVMAEWWNHPLVLHYLSACCHMLTGFTPHKTYLSAASSAGMHSH